MVATKRKYRIGSCPFCGEVLRLVDMKQHWEQGVANGTLVRIENGDFITYDRPRTEEAEHAGRKS